MMLKLSVIFVLACTALLFSRESIAQGTMGRWEMCGLSGTTSASVSPAGVNAKVTFSVLSRGAGITAASATNGYTSTSFSTSGTLTIGNNEYYEFTITPDPGYRISITSLKIRDQVSTTSNSPVAFLRYSDNAYGTNVVSSWNPSTTATNRTLTLSAVTALQNRTTPVTFRIYATSVNSSTTTTYGLFCQGTAAGNFRGVDVDGTVAQLAYASDFISMNTGSATWCTGETRNISVTVKNVGSANWTDATPDVNIGVKWNTNGTSWNNYLLRVDAGNLASGATQTYNFTITASNATGTSTPTYTTPLSAGTNNLTFDIIKEGDCNFGNNNGTCGPGNSVFTSPNQTITALSTLSRTSAVGTDAQTRCISTAITNITYLVGGGGTGATVTGLPTGVTGNYSTGTKVFTISGTPTVSGTFSYTVTTVSLCDEVSLGGTITVNANTTNTLSSGAGSNIQAICLTDAISAITYNIGGGGTGAGVTGLPAGVTGSFNAGVFTISGTPTASGTFGYTVTPTGPCTNPTTTGTITVNTNSTISRTSAAGTDAQTKCINTAITNITYLVGGGGTGAGVTGLPTGVTGSYNSGSKVFTISGTPTQSGSFSYTVTTTGPCTNTSLGGTIDVNAASTLTLTNAGTNTQTICIGSSIIDIDYTYGGTATGASITAGSLPAGVFSGDDAGGNFTITGTPTVTGVFNFTVTAGGICPVSLAGTITVNANSTITFTSAAGTNAQTKCISTPITNITYLVGAGGTGAGVTGLPSGVTGSYNSGTKVYTISGTPTVAGSFNYTVTTTGPCINTSLGGSIDVVANATISLTSGGGTNIQVKCASSPITNITYSIGGSGTGANVTGLPPGITGSYNAPVYTISGSADANVSGVFNYTITTTGPCATPNLTGTLTINAIPTTTGIEICQGGSGSLTSSYTCPSGSELTSGPNEAGTGTSNNTVGTGVWSNPGNITVAGSPYATQTLASGATSQYLMATNYAFDIPVNATISGITVVVNRQVATTSNMFDNSVRIVKAGAVTGSNLASAIAWPNTFGTRTYGGTTNLWGTTWTPANINASNFGVAIAANNGSGSARQADVDYIRITITYTVPGSINWYTVSSGGSSIGSGSSFNPVGVGGSGLTNTNTPGTTIYYAECSTLTGCRTPTEFTIKALPAVSITGSNSICLTGSTSLSPTTGGNWISNNASATVNNSGDVSPVSPGTATFTFTNAVTGCSNTTAPVTINANSTISRSSAVGTDAQSKCINTAITNITYAIGGGGTSASITSGALPAGVNGSFNAGVFTISGTPTVTGNYSYTVTTAGPCVNNSLSGTITVNPNATIILSSAAGTNAQSVCNNSAINPISYTVAGGGSGAGVTGLPAGVTGLFNAGVITITGTPTVAGVFNYTVTTTGTCVQAVANGSITVNALPTATFTRSNVSACGGSPDGSITITPAGGTGPYSYSWSGVIGSGNPATTPYPNPGNVSTVSNLTIGFYNVTVTDSKGCQVSINNIHVQYAFSAFVTNNGSISSACGNTGSIILYANAGVLPYTFSLDGNTFTSNNSFTNLAAGLYTAYVKDGAGCVISKSIQVNAAAPISVAPFVKNASSCAADGSIEIYRSGGIPPYAYSLDGVNYQPGNIYNNLAAGPYTTYVQDSKGCVGTQAVTITQGIALAVNVTKTNASTCLNDGSIQVNPSGGMPPYSYSINNGAFVSGNSFTGLAAGNYAIAVKDFKGCQGAINVTINLNTIVVTAFVANANDCSSDNGSIQLYRTGGVGPYTYSLDGNTYQSSSIFNNLPAGEYDGYVKDSKTCVGALFGIVVGRDCNRTTVATKGTIAPKAAETSTVKISTNSVLKISAYPNPSTESFTLLLQGGNYEKAMISVTDMVGRKVYQTESNSKQPIRFGSNLIPGIYMLQVIQGNEKQSIKLIKE